MLTRDADKSELGAREMRPDCSQDSKRGRRESLKPEGKAKPPAVGECCKPAGSRAVVPEGNRHQQRCRCSQLLLWLVPWFGAVVVGRGYLRWEENPQGPSRQVSEAPKCLTSSLSHYICSKDYSITLFNILFPLSSCNIEK